MSCLRIKEQIGPYVDGELSVDARAAVEEHLVDCPECSAALDAANAIAAMLSSSQDIEVPESLWPAIEYRLDHQAGVLGRRRTFQLFGAPTRAAAAIVLVIGLGILGLMLTDGVANRAEASPVNFGMLLDALPLDAQKAFRKFLVFYGARPIGPYEAKRFAAELNFEVPEILPGGFVLRTVYALRFGEGRGVAAQYRRGDEFLGTIFHSPVEREDFGTHKDLPCVIGQHRGHKVEVGRWKLVHLTDPTTCHCVLSRLDEVDELPAVLAAVAPGFDSAATPNETPAHAGHEH